MKEKTAIVLAAGLGTRMRSPVPKVLHHCAGRPMISLVLHELLMAGVEEVRVVVGHGKEQVCDKISKDFPGEKSKIKFFEQKKQLGTADAVKSADITSLQGSVLICNGDHPLITAQDYSEAFKLGNATDISVVTCVLKSPESFGRIVRNSQGQLTEIKESKEASSDELKIKEVNTGLYVVKAEILKALLPKIKNENSKKEFYLTDIVKLALKENKNVQALLMNRPRLSRGVNSLVELAQASRTLYLRKAKELMLQGVQIEDPLSTFISSTVRITAGASVGPGSKISGQTEIASAVKIEGNVLLENAIIGENTVIKWGSVIEHSRVGAGCVLGPYARIRPESELEDQVHIGNFVELKKTKMSRGAKANHLTYLGDAEIGEGTNIGCGTITCNYAVDKKKYKTKIGKNVFVGSDTQFIAPITIGDGAIIGSGSTITKDVPSKALAVARAKAFVKENYNKE